MLAFPRSFIASMRRRQEQTSAVFGRRFSMFPFYGYLREKAERILLNHTLRLCWFFIHKVKLADSLVPRRPSNLLGSVKEISARRIMETNEWFSLAWSKVCRGEHLKKLHFGTSFTFSLFLAVIVYSEYKWTRTIYSTTDGQSTVVIIHVANCPRFLWAMHMLQE